MHRLPTPVRGALFVVVGLVLAACGDADSTVRPPDPHPVPRGITFVDGFEAGAEASEDPDALLFVYVGRHNPTCPPCERMGKQVFSTPESAKISDTWTAVRIEGGTDLDKAGEAFMKRYGVRGYPTLLAVTAAGDLVDGDLLDGRLRDADYLFTAMTEANEKNRSFLAERDRLLAEGDAESLVTLAEHYVKRLRDDEARALYERALAMEPSARTTELLVGVLQHAGDAKAERKTLDRMIEQFSGHPNRMAWRMRRATMHVEAPTSAFGMDVALARMVEALEELRARVASEGRPGDEAAVRVRLAEYERQRRRAEVSTSHIDWILEKTPDTPAALDALILQAEGARERRDAKTAREYAERVLEKAPESRQAARAHMLLGDLAYGDADLDRMRKHFEAVVRLAPDSSLADVARQALDSVKRRRERDGR